MTKFGTSAYLKLLGLNPKPQNTSIKERLKPSKDGYDFHRKMRRLATDFASGAVNYETTQALLKGISRDAERKSAISAISDLVRWLDGRPIRPTDNAVDVQSSPNGIFSVKFAPDFEMELSGSPVRIHMWNTIKPEITLREAIGVLGLFVNDEHPTSIGILSLRSGELFVPDNGPKSRELARFLALDIERKFARVIEEMRGSARGDDAADRRPRA